MSTKTLRGPSVRQLETVEAAAWGDIFRSPRAGAAAELGLKLINYDGAVISMATKLDILAMNRAIRFGVNRPATLEDIEWLKSLYALSRVPRFFVTVSPETAPETEKNLIESGFEHYNNWAKLSRPVTPLGIHNNELDIRLCRPEDAEAYGKIGSKCFEWPEETASWFTATIGRKNWYNYIIHYGDVPGTIGSMYHQGDSAYIALGATLPHFRGQGGQAAVTKARIDQAIKLGVERIIVETAEETPKHPAPSYRNMIRFGFRRAYLRKNYIYRF